MLEWEWFKGTILLDTYFDNPFSSLFFSGLLRLCHWKSQTERQDRNRKIKGIFLGTHVLEVQISDYIHDISCNSLWPSDTIWRHRTESTLAQVMACCLMAPSQYLDQCWLIISGIVWHLPVNDFIGSTRDINLWNEFEIYAFKITATSPKWQ